MNEDGKTVARTCTTCEFCLRDDYGYSNWTVEGTSLHCLKGLNPKLDGKEDETWREPSPEVVEALDVALTCESYVQGAGVWLDCDREGWPYKEEEQTLDAVKGYTDHPEAAGLLFRYLKGLPPESP